MCIYQFLPVSYISVLFPHTLSFE